MGMLEKLLKPAIKGAVGEAVVGLNLTMLNPNEYITINNVMLKTESYSDANITTSQIDHVVVSIYGIFIVETKNYSGLVVGDQYSAKWMHYSHGDKHQFVNPIRQNYGHKKAMEYLLEMNGRKGNVPVYPIVVFPDTTKLNLKLNGATVTSRSQLITTIKSLSVNKVIDQDEIKALKSMIESNRVSGIGNHLEHVVEIQQMKLQQASKKVNNTNDVAKGNCPACGGKLVLRNGKYGQFWGCCNYPDCKFTSKV